VLIGLFVIDYSSFTLLFLFFLLLYFGRTTWGDILNVIPAMREFHQSRFIVGIHAAGIFLAPIGLMSIIKQLSKRFTIPYPVFSILICIIIVALVYPQTIRYAKYNDVLIAQANGNYAKQSTDANALVSTLQDLQKTAPGRVFAGRGGSWGKDFRIAETPMYMYLSNFALSSVLWLPETWSPNGDTEQYFREDKAEDYALYNIRYVVTPASLAKTNIQPFWKLLKENPSWKLYEVPTPGYFTVGVRPAVVAADKYSRTNVIRLWIQSSDPKNGLYPEFSFDTKKYPVHVGLPNFKMTDEVTFITPDGKTHNVFSEPPRYLSDLSNPSNLMNITSQSEDTDMIFKATVNVKENCTECMVILKQTYHPNWKVTVDGKPITPIITFPFFIGIPISAGSHIIVASYEPSRLKITLLLISLITLISLMFWFLARKLGIDKKAINISH
jgi:Bacterial membrane protein YfhO